MRSSGQESPRAVLLFVFPCALLLNEQVKRNRGRFPGDFMFRLTEQEKQEVVANCNLLSRLKYSNLKILLKRSGVWQIHLKRSDIESGLTAIFL